MAVVRRAQPRVHEITDTTTANVLSVIKKPNLPTLDKFLCAKTTDARNDKTPRTPGIAVSSFNIVENELLLRLSLIDETVQGGVLQALRATIFNFPTIQLSLVIRKGLTRTTHLDMELSGPLCRRMFIIQSNTMNNALE